MGLAEWIASGALGVSALTALRSAFGGAGADKQRLVDLETKMRAAEIRIVDLGEKVNKIDVVATKVDALNARVTERTDDILARLEDLREERSFKPRSPR